MNANADNFDKEAAEFFKKEDEKAVTALQEALHIDRMLKLCLKYIQRGLITVDMPLIEVLEIMEKRKFKLIGINPEKNGE